MHYEPLLSAFAVLLTTFLLVSKNKKQKHTPNGRVPPASAFCFVFVLCVAVIVMLLLLLYYCRWVLPPGTQLGLLLNFLHPDSDLNLLSKPTGPNHNREKKLANGFLVLLLVSSSYAFFAVLLLRFRSS